MKLFVGICNSQDFVPAMFFWSFISISPPCQTYMFRSPHPLDAVRNNVLIEKFLESDADILAKMDIDQVYPHNYFQVMVPLADKYKVIGPIVFDRHRINGFMPLAFANKDYLKLREYDISNQRGIVEVPFPHTQLFYHREVLEKIEPPWYETNLNESGTERGNHFDFEFLDKIHKAGYKIHINLDLTVEHITYQQVDKQFYNTWQAGVRNDVNNEECRRPED